MKAAIKYFLLSSMIFLISCGNSTGEKSTQKKQANTASATSSIDAQQTASIVGEWNQDYVCFDKNGNYKLETEEKKPSGTHLGFDWFSFNPDGTCQWDKDVKFKGTYEIQEKSSSKKLVIQGGDKLRYTITELTDKELILGTDGAFIVFKKIK